MGYVLTRLGRAGVGRLGALPSYPPNSLLGSGKTWYRYLVSPDVQWTTCPPSPPYGCTMYGGYAWGQWPGSEFGFAYITPTGQTSTGSASVATSSSPSAAESVCSQELWDWYNQSTAAKCLDLDQQAKVMQLCVDYKAGKMTVGEYADERNALANKACNQRECERLYDQWADAFPDQAKCLNSNQRDQIRRICYKGRTGEYSGAEATEKTLAVIEEACAAAGSPIPSVVTTSPSMPTSSGAPLAPPTAPHDTLPEEAPDFFTPEGGQAPSSDLVSDGGGYLPETDGAGQAGEEKSLLRQLGPVVGIGLVAALGLTLARKRKGKLTKRRKRK